MKIFESFRNIFAIPDLRKRVLFTFGLLAIYRIGSHIPTPGLDPTALEEFFKASSGGILGFLDVFSGGALRRLSVFAMGIAPYITASIILQLLTVVWPYLEKLSKEGEMGRRKITQYTRYGTVVLSVVQGAGISLWLWSQTTPSGRYLAVRDPGSEAGKLGFILMAILTLTTGTAFVMWLGEQITERGIGNGISLIIFAGIVVRIPSGLGQLVELIRTDQFTLLGAILLLAFMVFVVGFVVFFERGQRRIPIQHARRVVGRRVTQGGMSYFPLRVNTAGVIPPIFASSILMFPLTIGQFADSPALQQFFQDYLFVGGALYESIYVGLIIFFAFFYTAVVINPTDVADNIKRFGGFIPGIRPGKKTAEHIDHVLSRITLVGALYVAAVCVMPSVLSAQQGVPFYFGGTALLIIVGVALDTIGQIEAHLVSRQYEGFVKGTRVRGRLGR